MPKRLTNMTKQPVEIIAEGNPVMVFPLCSISAAFSAQELADARTAFAVDDTSPHGKEDLAWEAKWTTADNAVKAAIPTVEDIRIKAFIVDPDRQTLLAQLMAASPAEIDTWLAGNVTTLAQARKVLGMILKLLVLMSRQ